MSPTPHERISGQEVTPKATFRRIGNALKQLSEVRGQELYLSGSPLWAGEGETEMPDEVIGTRTIIGEDLAEGTIRAIWLNDRGSELLKVLIPEEEQASAGKLLGYLEFAKQENDDTYFYGEMYLYEYAGGSSDAAEVTVRCKGVDLRSESDKFFEYYRFAESLGMGDFWSDSQEAGLQERQDSSGVLDGRTGSRVAHALQNLARFHSG